MGARITSREVIMFLSCDAPECIAETFVAQDTETMCYGRAYDRGWRIDARDGAKCPKHAAPLPKTNEPRAAVAKKGSENVAG